MKVDAIYLGPPKSASTWLYYCLKEHPEISVPKTDCSRYFDINCYLDKEKFLEEQFENSKNKIKVDFSQDYLMAKNAAKNIYENNPNAKLIVCLRNPIDRAFSHYWHIKKKNSITYDFSRILESYDPFSTWLEAGFYAHYLEEYYKYFKKEQILILFFEDLKKDSDKFLKTVLDFLEVKDNKFKPKVLNQKVNEAGYKTNWKLKMIRKTGRTLKKVGLYDTFVYLKKKGVVDKTSSMVSNKSEYDKGVDPKLRKKLLKIVIPEIEDLEKLIDKDLSHWKK